MIQSFSIECDTFLALKDYLIIAMADILCPLQEVAVKIIENKAEYSPCMPASLECGKNPFFVVLIEGGSPRSGQFNNYFNGYKPWEIFPTKEPNQVVDILEPIEYINSALHDNYENWKKEFIRRFGDGGDGWDRTVKIGFRLEWYPNGLGISLAHIIYGK